MCKNLDFGVGSVLDYACRICVHIRGIASRSRKSKGEGVGGT